MAPQPYERPPITEAIIQIVFGAALTEGDLGKLNTSFSKNYPEHKETTNFQIEVTMPERLDAERADSKVKGERGHRRSSNNESQIVIMWPHSFIFSQLAPYPGWDEFFGRFVRDWELWKRVLGHRSIIRVGVRYINRIDIPITGPVLDHENFLNVYPKLPEEIEVVGAYMVQAQLPFPEVDGKIIITSASVPSPLMDHASYLFDQDLAKESNLPQNDDGLYRLLNDIHVKKNAIFEMCITDRAREIFGKWPD
jgi:uncharacterized protein (TIGR04255 family)